jgi:hypothetical protein
MATRRMFDSTTNFFHEFTGINDFAQISAASVWTMRWQVKGFFAEAGFYNAPSVRPKQSDLRSRFLAGSGLNRANFRALVDGQNWPEQLSVLAEMTLLAFVSLFEGWNDAIGSEAGLTIGDRGALQWPSFSKYPRYNRVGNPVPGIGEALQAGRSMISPLMSTCFYPVYKRDRQYSLAQLDELMVCYRYWKEVRNALAHSGGKATSRLIAEEARLNSLTPPSLGMTQIPKLGPLTLDNSIPMELRSVLGFGEILHRIAVTVDTELSESDKAETIMIKRWEKLRREHYNDAPLAKVRRRARIQDWMFRAGLARPEDLGTLDTFLSARYGPLLRVR